MSDFNQLLHRNIKSGFEYDSLIPKTFCNKTDAGQGDTDYSVQIIAEVIDEYSFQAEKLAKVLKGNNLKKTCLNIKKFIYDHFQYRADDDEQMLRSIACSWFDRKKGIDCKSFSIAAGSILKESNIVFFIRKIKQPAYEPRQWTHVYIIVPIDQINYNLSKGYYTIDGTLKENTECEFIEKQDKIMALNHSKLNGGLDADNDGQIKFNDAVVLAEKFGKDIAKFFKNLGCIGGQGYDQGKWERNVVTFTNYYTENIKAINQAILDKKFDILSNEVLNYFGDSTMIVLGSKAKKAEGWNSCSTSKLDAQIKLAEFYQNIVGKSLKEYLNKYFVATPTTELVEYKSDVFEKQLGFMFVSQNQKDKLIKINYTPKGISIPAFELTQYMIDSKDVAKDFDPIKAVQEFSKILLKDTTPVNNNSDVKPYVAGSSQAGFGVFGWVVVLAGLGFAFTKMKDNPETSTTAKKRVYKSKSK